ncbi:MAG TPA: Xaa-Pro peptidase family protein [Verrucomicrobiae bacterium]|jgi:Xaa-Pro aminopeptidase|nr:Xaa-Pro peptidase family protein [Verrucomicrobiae bacterium]
MDGPQEYSQRMSKIRQGMRDQGIETLLIFDSGRHNFLRMNYVAYLTDFISIGPETILVVPAENEPILFLTPSWDIARAKDESWVADIRPFKDFWSLLSKLSGKIGLVGREAMHIRLHDEIVKTLKRAPVNAKDLIENIARRKTEFELERLRKAAAIADAGVQALHEDARPGLKEYELAAIVEHRMRSLGAEDNFGMVVAHHHNSALHPPTARVVEKGDIIIGEITPCVGGLFVQICRTVVLGQPPPVVEEKYAILKRAMRLGMDAAKTGAPASDVAAAINGTLIEAGYEKYCRPPFMRVRGHGLGCGSSAPGNLEDGNETPLEEGMTFIVHPNQYLPETGYMTLGDTVLMTRSKAEPMTHSSWDLYVKD